MPQKANVVIKYGPYRSNGVLRFKEERLLGLQNYLQSRGHKVVVLQQVQYWNCMEVFVNDEKVFTAKLDELEFGGDGELDPLVIQAETAVVKAY